MHHANPALTLPDFSATAPDTLQTAVETELVKLHALLDTFATETPTIADDALADIVRLETMENALEHQWGLLSHLNAVMSNDDIRDAHHAVLPQLSEYGTRLGQHQQLFARFNLVKHDATAFNSLSQARQRSIELAIRSFELSGVGLDDDKKKTYADISSQLSKLSATFSDNVLDATQAYKRVLTTEEIAGITETGLAMLKANGEKYLADNPDAKPSNDEPLYVATLDIPVYIAIMTHASHRPLREEIYKAYSTRASEVTPDYDNADNMAKILSLRAEKAALLGFNNFAELSIATKMADSPQEVFDFLNDLAKRAKAPAGKDLAQLQNIASDYGIDNVQPWDTSFLSEKVKQAEFNLSQETLRPYFPLPKVISGLFAIVKTLYNIDIVQVQTSLWHDDASFYEVHDAAHGELIGGFYFDLYARTGKRGGAWMNGFQSKVLSDGLNQLPVAFMVCNFTPPTQTDAGEKPALLTHNEVTTLFHEFGHGLHHILTKVGVPSVAGVNGVEWDAVELPSQFMEFWAWEPEGLELISGHVDTGEILPQALLDAMLAARHFQSGMMALRQLEFALFDLSIHAADNAPDAAGIQDILNNVRADVSLVKTPEYNRFQNGFSHIFAGGYAAGYYSYKWAELLASDAFDRFEAEGVFNTDTGNAFRTAILEAGGSQPASETFAAFRGRKPSIEPLLRHSGWDVKAA